MNLNWEYHADGCWIAYSRYHDGGRPFQWQVDITRAGEFSVGGSTGELLAGEKPPHFSSLKTAQQYCNEKEFEKPDFATHSGTDFSLWSRPNLEKLAADLTAEVLALKSR